MRKKKGSVTSPSPLYLSVLDGNDDFVECVSEALCRHLSADDREDSGEGSGEDGCCELGLVHGIAFRWLTGCHYIACDSCEALKN